MHNKCIECKQEKTLGKFVLDDEDKNPIWICLDCFITGMGNMYYKKLREKQQAA